MPLNDVLITVKSSTTSFGNTENSVQTFTGTCAKKGNADYLFYTEISNNSAVKTIVKAIGSTKVCITRRGNVESNLTVETGVTIKSDYKNEYGSFPIEITGKKIENCLNKNTLFFEYSITSGGKPLSDVKIEILLSEVNK